MTAVKDIIQEAFEESGLLADTNHPTRTQFDKALARLQRIVDGVYDFEAGVKLTDWMLGDADVERVEPSFSFVRDEIYPEQNSRLIATNTTNITVYLPYQPDDGARIQIVDPQGTLATNTVTLHANGRSIESADSVAALIDGRMWFYRADQGDWVRIADLTATGDMPFPSKFDDYFIIMLAKRLNPKYGSISHRDSDARLVDVRRRMQATYAQSYRTPVAPGLQTPYGRSNFNTGRTY